MLLRVLIFRVVSIILILISINTSAYQEKKSFTEEDFDKIHFIFENRFKRFRKTKIKIKKSFRDSLFTIQKWAQKNGTAQQKIIADYQVFFAYNQLIDNDKIIYFGIQLINNKDFIEMPESVYVSREILSAYDRKGFYRKLLEFYDIHKKLNLKHNTNNNIIPVENYYRLAMVYYKLENYTKARLHFQLQANYLLENKKLFRAGSMYNNIGLTFEKQHQFSKAIASYTESLQLLKRDKQKDIFFTDTYKNHFKNVVASNIASINLKQLNFNGVETVFLNELKSSIQVNEPRTIIQGYLNLSEYNVLTKKFDKAIQFLDSSFVKLYAYESPTLLARANLIKGKYLLSQQKNKEAEIYFLKNEFITDSLNRVKVARDFEEASLQFNLNVVEEDLKSSKEIIKKQNTISINQWIIIAVISVLSIVFLLLFIRIWQDNKSIKQSKKELSKSLQNNKTLLEEIHHRIKNNLQIISGILDLKSSKLNDKVSEEVFSDTQQYIESMSYIHEHLYTQEARALLKMDDYFTKLTNAIVHNYSAKNITVSINVDAIVMNTENATPLGLLICELVTNSAKHAFDTSGKITIDLQKKEQQFFLHYFDDGKGFDLNKKSKPGQIGVNLMKMLIEELNAESKQYIKNGYHIELQFNEIV